ncbi:uncharacterized protein LAESUDRAFT_757648 [Laetiporus sulphureus 93-53]|uniref:DRBM domain-containing protein n=1 Tax=Laetiporus sulphureus 93-53 TaxID=1314785 RepID=A0A165F554_9APHY|nr:uncharacterized protein LAESUDRAFT_757648 [Laetiporus sulphureus 93-53]KZT08412.1 hypothetical protein LAESUDRAFT_757648 [Laetiporus sulphureus 93-53]
MSEGRMHLNNWLQRNYGSTNVLDWDVSFSGAGRSMTWTVIAKIRNVEYGRATNSNKGQATDQAAEQALRELRARHGH